MYMGKTLLSTLLFSLILFAGMAQTPGIKWSKYVGTQVSEEVYTMASEPATKATYLWGSTRVITRIIQVFFKN